MTLTGCQSSKLIQKAATDFGIAQARVVLPPYPDDCRVKEIHAQLKAGAEVRSILKRERAALDRQNARTARCAKFYDSLQAELK